MVHEVLLGLQLPKRLQLDSAARKMDWVKRWAVVQGNQVRARARQTDWQTDEVRQKDSETKTETDTSDRGRGRGRTGTGTEDRDR
eukprot:1097301-Rhodomonas_salina.2